MKKVFFLFLFPLFFLGSCQAKGQVFKADDWKEFLKIFDDRNFTLNVSYDELYENQVVNHVKYSFQVCDNIIYRKNYTYGYNEKNPKIETLVYSYKEANQYIEYTYQTDDSGMGPKKTYVKEVINEKLYENSFNYGSSFIFDYLLEYKYNEHKQIFEGHNITIKISNDTITIKNAEINMIAVFSKVGVTKISKPEFVKKYKEDIIER